VGHKIGHFTYFDAWKGRMDASRGDAISGMRVK
jgi:hypothetical protein